jgi:CRP-like cAMP-binding protein
MPQSHGGANRLLQRLPAEELARLQPHFTSVPLRRGAVLHRAGDAIEHVFFPLSGMVALLAVAQGGDAIETALIGCEGIVGGSVANDNWHSFAQAIVQISGAALRINGAHLAAAAGVSPTLRVLVNRSQGVLLLQAQQNGLCHALHDVEPRLCRWLLQAQDTVENNRLELTQEFLSHMLGVQRTAVSLSAHKLQEAGLLEYSRGHITIVDRAGVEACACECYAVIRAGVEKALLSRRS